MIRMSKNIKLMRRIASLVIMVLFITTFQFKIYAKEPNNENVIKPYNCYDLCYVNTEGGNLNCRSGAGTEYSIVGKFKNGTQLSWSVFGATDKLGRDWTSVSGQDINGKIISGWVLDEYLRYESCPHLKYSIFNRRITINLDLPDVG